MTKNLDAAATSRRESAMAKVQPRSELPRDLPDMKCIAADGIRKLVVDTDLVDEQS
jgi:hypothetical protein